MNSRSARHPHWHHPSPWREASQPRSPAHSALLRHVLHLPLCRSTDDISRCVLVGGVLVGGVLDGGVLVGGVLDGGVLDGAVLVGGVLD